MSGMWQSCSDGARSGRRVCLPVAHKDTALTREECLSQLPYLFNLDKAFQKIHTHHRLRLVLRRFIDPSGEKTKSTRRRKHLFPTPSEPYQPPYATTNQPCEPHMEINTVQDAECGKKDPHSCTYFCTFMNIFQKDCFYLHSFIQYGSFLHVLQKPTTQIKAESCKSAPVSLWRYNGVLYGLGNTNRYLELGFPKWQVCCCNFNVQQQA